MSREKGQHNQRYPDTFYDQHGREYYTSCEKETNDPVSISFADWTAPLEPAWARKLLLPPLDDREVVRVLHRSVRNKVGYQIEIDYDRWAQKIDLANETRRRDILTIAREQFKGADLLKSIEGDAPPEVLKFVGPEAMPPREAIMAMKHGDKWALGVSAIIPEKAKPILDRMRRAHDAAMLLATVHTDDGNPFADDGDEEANPFRAEIDPYGDLEEEVDPKATGGTLVRTRKRKGAE